MSDSIKNFALAMAQFQGEVKNPPKSADNPFFKSKYTTLDTVIDTIKPILAKHGLSYIQSCHGDGQSIAVTTLMMHSSGEWVETDPLVLKADKATAQGAGSAVTYARRYALTAAFGVASDDDDDGNVASNNVQSKDDVKSAIEQHKQTTGQQDNIKKLMAMAKEAGYSEEAVKKHIKEKFNLESRTQMTDENFEFMFMAYQKVIDTKKKGAAK